MKFKVLWMAGLMLAATAGQSEGAFVTFTHTGTGAGSIAGNAFASSAFTITGIADTSNRQSFIGGYWINHTSASINIIGQGVFTFTNSTRTFFNDSNDTVGFSRGSVSGTDLYNGPGTVLLNGWDMLSSIGPVNGNTRLLQWFPGVDTSGGVLFFNNLDTTGTFEAVVGSAPVPEPASIAMWGLGAIGLVFARRKRQQKKLAA